MAGTERRILVINPGSTSTKAALFADSEKTAERTVEHSVGELRNFEHLFDQLFFREAVIRRFLRDNRWETGSLDAVVGRGGMLHPLEGGIYRIGAAMLADLRSGRFGLHASNLGAPLAGSLPCPPTVRHSSWIRWLLMNWTVRPGSPGIRHCPGGVSSMP